MMTKHEWELVLELIGEEQKRAEKRVQELKALWVAAIDEKDDVMKKS
jgi:hypothetical protein